MESRSKSLKIGDYLGIAVFIAGIIITVYYTIFTRSVDIFSSWAVICMAGGLVCEAAGILKKIGGLPVLSVMLFEAALMIFVNSSLPSFVDYFNGVKMFGGTGEMGKIFFVIGFLLVMILVEIVSCFMTRNEKEL